MAQKAREYTTVSYNSHDVTAYATQADLDMAVGRLDTTNLASSDAESITGDVTYKITLQGNWSATLDGWLGADVGAGTPRTAYIAYTDGATTVTYTWTSKAEIENYSIKSPANGLRTFSCDLMLSGAPNRTSA